MLAAAAPVYQSAAVSMEVKPEMDSYASGLKQGGREQGMWAEQESVPSLCHLSALEWRHWAPIWQIVRARESEAAGGREISIRYF